MQKTRKLAIATTLVLVLFLSFSFFAVSATPRTKTEVSSPPILTISTTRTAGVWRNYSQGATPGTGTNYPPVTFGADDSRDPTSLGPSVMLGTVSYTPVSIPANTFVAESFPVSQVTFFNMIVIAFSIPNTGGPNVTMYVYVNGQLLVQNTRSLALSSNIASNPHVAPTITASTYFFLSKTYTIAAGSVVTIGFVAQGPIGIFPIQQVVGNSSAVPNMASAPTTWTGPPTGALTLPIFLADGLASPTPLGAP
ncbi:MAG TPA: hypothetical protein VJN71_11260 [Nitrososphaerales archaeon]|nr:hypothetical protein [Nitrososphaerales archaeon]